MNVENILKIAQIIEPLRHTEEDARSGFYMGNYLHPCGTPSCIAGWAVAKLHPDPKTVPRAWIDEEATKLLGLDPEQSCDLFLMSSADDTSMKDATPKQAAAVLRDLAATGRVRWDRFDADGNVRSDAEGEEEGEMCDE